MNYCRNYIWSLIRLRKYTIYSLIVITFLSGISLYFGEKNIAFSIGGDSYGSFTFFEHTTNGTNTLSVYGQPLAGTDKPLILNHILYLLNRLFAAFSNNAAVYFNIHFIFNVLSTFLVTFILGSMLLDEIENKRIMIILFAIMITFSHYNLMHSFTGHQGFLSCFLLIWLYAFYRFYRHQSLKNTILSGTSFAISFLYSPYYGYFGMMIFLVALIYIYFYERNKFKIFFINSVIWVSMAALIIATALYPFLEKILFARIQPESSWFNRPFDSVWGVVPWMYILPTPQHFIATEGYSEFYRKVMMTGNVPENSVYLGWFNIVFFLYGLILYCRKKLQNGSKKWFQFSLIAAFFCFLLSMPPYIPLCGEKRIYWISAYLHKFFPMFRIFNRIGFFVLIFVSIGGLIGFNYFLIKHNVRKKIIIVISIFFIIFELTPKIPLLDVGKIPDVYEWLKKEPGNFIIYELPVGNGNDDYVFYKYLYYQTYHKKRLFNRSKVKVDLKSKDFYKKMKEWDVKYIIQHEDLYSEGPIPYEHKPYVLLEVGEEKFNCGFIEKLPDWYKIEKKIGDTVVYKIL
jgi:hypothetical protein